MKIPANATPAQVRALYAAKHAEGAARVRAILASEAPAPSSPGTKSRNHTHERREARRKRAAEVWDGLERSARTNGASIAFRLDIKTVNPLNGLGRSRLASARDKKKHRSAALFAMRIMLNLHPLAFPCRVLIRRVAPSSGLDEHDALPATLKSVCDGIADALGLASDRDERVGWVYAQRRGLPTEYAVEIEVRPMSHK